MKRDLIWALKLGIVVGGMLAVVLLCSRCASAAVDEVHFTIISQSAVTFDWRATASEYKIFYSVTQAKVTSLSSPVDSVTAATGSRSTSPPSIWPFSSAGPFAEAKITGLTEATTYYYKIGTAGQVHTFKTPIPRGSSDFSIAIEGDIGDTTSYSQVGGVQDRVLALNPDWVLMVGDLTYANDHGQAHVDVHFNNVMKWSQDAAYMPCWGNHEWDKPTGSHTQSGTAGDDLRNYKGRFDLPNPKGAVGVTDSSQIVAGAPYEDWYWFDYGNVRFIAYPEPTSGAITNWKPRADSLMAAVDADPAIQFIVTFGHRPAYSSAHHPGESGIKAACDALGLLHPKYVLNVNGHSHNYERTYPQNGVVHITSGGGGGTYEERSNVDGCLYGPSDSSPGTCPPPSYSAARAYRYGPTLLTFHNDKISGRQICGPSGSSGTDVTCTAGDDIDAFEILAAGCSCPIAN